MADIHPQGADAIKRKFVSLLEKAASNSAGFSIVENWDDFHSLEEELNKHPQISQYFNIHDLMGYVDLLFREKPQKISQSAFISESTDQFIKFLKGLPYEVEFTFGLPLNIPDHITEITFGTNISLENCRLENGKVNVRSLGLFVALPTASSLFKIKVNGYGEQATIKATNILKSFLVLSIVEKTIIYRYELRDIEDNHLRATIKVNNADLPFRNIWISSDLEDFLHCIVLSSPSENDKTVSPDLFKNRFSFFDRYINLQSKYDYSYIESACYWRFESLIAKNKSVAFIQTCIAIEAILGSGTESIKKMMAERCAHLLGKNRFDRELIKKDIEDIYECRSKLVHGTQTELTKEQRLLAFKAEGFFNSILKKELSL